MPMGTAQPANAAGLDVTGVAAESVRFSDNDSVPMSIDAGVATWRLRAPRNRNSVTVTVKDQYGATYGGGDHDVRASDTDNAGDFPAATQDYAISSSGRRSIGYTHTGDEAQQQTVMLQLRSRGDAAADVGDEKTVSVLWADRGAEDEGDDEPILLGDPGSNHILVNEHTNPSATNVEPAAYGYGSDDKFVVEGEVVTMDQFEEILAAFGDAPKLIASLGTLSWVGYDYNRPNDGATWTIDDLSCRAPASGGD